MNLSIPLRMKLLHSLSNILNLYPFNSFEDETYNKMEKDRKRRNLSIPLRMKHPINVSRAVDINVTFNSFEDETCKKTRKFSVIPHDFHFL